LKDDLSKVEVKSLAELQKWLRKNHTQKESVWLVTYKKIIPEFYIEYSDVVDELLCFGWIDSLPRKLDETRKMLRISPRKPKSVWSKINRDKVEKMIAAGKMNKAGLEIIKLAKENGSWDVLKPVDSNLVPNDLKLVFSKHPNSEKNFAAFPASTRRAILEWIVQAKTETTRQKRILETARLASKNLRANQYKPAGKKKIQS